MSESRNEQFESERKELNTIVAGVLQEHVEYNLNLRTGAEDASENVRKFHKVLGRSIEALRDWDDKLRAKIQQVFVTEHVSAPKHDDPAWELVRQGNARALIRSLKEEKRRIESWLESRPWQDAGEGAG